MSKSEQQKEATSIELVSESFIKPKHEMEPSKTSYHLGPVDLVMLSLDPIQKGLLYTFNKNINTNRMNYLPHLLDNLKNSLSYALVYYYPLAGRFTTQVHENETASWIFIDCNKGPGARFIHARALDVTVDDVLSPTNITVVRPFFDLGEKMVNYDGHTKALLSIQVTELLDGLFIGFSMNHSVGDGTSFINFVDMLSEIYRLLEDGDIISEKISRMPVFNYRPWLSHDDNNEIGDALKFQSLDVGNTICRGYDPGPLKERIFHFSKSSMAKLKAMANNECGVQNTISSFQALTSFVWRSITKARNLPPKQQTICFLPVGARARFDPPVSEDHFGNLVSKIDWRCSVEELLSNGLGWVAMNIQKQVKAHNEKIILDNFKEIVKSPQIVPRGLYPNPFGETGLIIGGSPRFDIYGAEFGLGRALVTRIGYGNKEDGKINVNPGCEGDGSVDLEICLRPHIMAILEVDEEFMSFVSS